MQFLPNAQPPEDRGHRGRRGLSRWLLACCVSGVVATAFPWSYVEATNLFGEIAGPIAARTNPGFTCVTTCLLTGLLAMAEGRSRDARESVRTACLFLMGAATVVMLAHLVKGPSELFGVTATHSTWCFLAALAVAGGFAVSKMRMPRNPRVSGGAA